MDEIAESPCIEICCMDGKGVCVGCFLSQVEIDQWDVASNQDRLAFLQNALQRKNAQSVHE